MGRRILLGRAAIVLDTFIALAATPGVVAALSPSRVQARRVIVVVREPARRPVPVAPLASAVPQVAPRRAVDRAGEGPAVNADVDVSGPAIPLPPSFLGLSTEYWDLPQLDPDPHLLARVFGLLHVGGDGPMVLRVGGDSADHTYWDGHTRASDFQVYRLTTRWFGELAALTRLAHLKLLLDLNLAARAPAMAAAFTREALAVLPRHAIEAFEVGNEPDIYHREPLYRLAALADTRLGTRSAWGHYSAVAYAGAFRTYANAVASSDGGTPLAGPEVANPRLDLRWLTRLVAVDRPAVGLLTAHRYPLSACATPGSPLYPTIARVLSPASSAGLARSVAPAVALAARARVPFRLTEVNSVTCGGRAGVSNTFATALWAPDAMFSLLQAHVGGVNLHIHAGKPNAAFAVDHGRLVARPLLYGLLTFARALGPGAELLPTRVHAARRLNISVWAVRTDHQQLHVLALDKGSHAVRVFVHVPTSGAGTVERLIAPGVRSTGHVTLAGQSLGPQGQWLGRRVLERVAARPGGYELTLRAYSGALLRVRLGDAP